MAELTVENTYGKALFEAAKDVNKVDVILEEIIAVRDVFRQESDFNAFFNTPALSGPEKKKVVERVFSKEISVEVCNFLYVLIDKRRTSHFSKIVKEYQRLVNEQNGVSFGTIYSIEPLTDVQLRGFEEKTGKLLKKTIKLKNEIDSSIMGGVKIFVEGKVIDASIRKRLHEMESSIKQA